MTLIGYWNLDTNSNDFSGYGNNATDTNVSYTTGKINGAGVYNGTNSKSLIGAVIIPFGSDFSLCGWVYCEGALGGISDNRGIAFGSISHATDIRGVGVRINKSTGALQITWGNNVAFGVGIDVVSNIITTNKQKWYHIALTWTNSTNTMKVYINAGAPTTNSTHAIATSETNFEIGHGNLNSSESYWYGMVDDVRIYDYVLDSSEITTLYNMTGAPRFQINIGDSWKAVASVQINIGDTWKPVSSAQINIGDAWKQV